MATVLFESTKNQFARNALTRKFLAIVAATQSGDPNANFVVLPVADVEKLKAAEPTYINVAPSQDNGKTQAVQATRAGIAAAAEAAPVAPIVKVPHVAAAFVVEKDMGEPPPINRGGDRAMIYPFADLEINDSFFVAATEAIPDPGKELASSVSSANRRFSTTDPARKFTMRANVLGKDGVTKGARIYRIALPLKAAPAAPAAEVAAPAFTS